MEKLDHFNHSLGKDQFSIPLDYSYLDIKTNTLSAQKPYAHSLHVTTSDIDDLGHANNVVYVRWVQEVAAAHWNHTASRELREKYAWVVLRHEIDYKHPAFLNDEISGQTWVGEYHGARFDRFVNLFIGPKLIASAKTTWCLLDSETLRPTRVPIEITSLL